MTVWDMEGTYLVDGHRERVNVTLLRGVAVREAELRWVEQFWGHVADNSWFGCCRTAWLHDRGIGYDTSYTEVSQACGTVIAD